MITTLASIDLQTWVSICIKALAYATTLLAAGSGLISMSIKSFGADVRSWLRRFAILCAIAGAVFSVLRLPVRASFLTGGSLEGAFDPVMLSLVVESPLGTSVGVRLIGLVLIIAILLPVRWVRWVAATGSVIVCASFALRGHTLGPPRLLLGGLVTMHMVALAFWLGALAPLLRTASREPSANAGRAAREFGERAIWAVGILVVAGVAALLLLGVNDRAAFSTSYGQAIAFKLLLFAGVMLFAAANKFLLTPALLQSKPNASERLQRSIRLEALLIAGMLMTTATFTTVSSPPKDETMDTAKLEESHSVPTKLY